MTTTPEPVDLLATAGTVVTMDATNRVFAPGAVAVRGDRIVAVGPRDEVAASVTPTRTLVAGRAIIMPGLVDAYAHAGHGMIKAIYTARHGWPASQVYFHATTPEWWEADALLTAVERIRFGVTTGVSILGATPARADDPVYAEAHVRGVARTGIRDVLGIGPPDPFLGHIPSPWRATDLRGPLPVVREFTYAHCMTVSEDVIRRCHGAENGRLRACLAIPYLLGLNPRVMSGSHCWRYSDDDIRLVAANAAEARALADRLGVLIHTHCARGAVEFAAEQIGRRATREVLRGPTVIAHGHGLTLRDVELLEGTGASVSWVPFGSWGTRFGPAPLPELLRAGVPVCVATDGAAPFHVSDLFLNVHRALYLIWEAYEDMTALSEGKALRLVTIDAAACLGMDDQVGSLERGKKADFIIIGTDRPHLVPTIAVPQLLAYYVRGSDVETVVIDGRVVMDHGRIVTVDEQAVLQHAREEAARALARVDLAPYLDTGPEFWQGDARPRAGSALNSTRRCSKADD